MIYHFSHKAEWLRALVPVVVLAVLLPFGDGWPEYFPSLPGLLELLSVLMGAMVFLVGWSMPRAETDRNPRWLAAVFLGVAALDLLHLLVAGGAGLFSGHAGNRVDVFWLSARLLAAGGLLVVAWRSWGRPGVPGQGHRLLASILAFAVSEFCHALQRGPEGAFALGAPLYQLLGYGLACRVLVFDALRQLRARLEEAGALRTAKEAAEQALAARSEFLAQMSHEIRTPLNAIMGLVHLAQATDPTPRQLGYLKRMEHSSRHLLGIVDEVLDFSRIDAGRLELERVELELERVLEGALDLSADMAARKGLELVLDLADDVPARLVGDPLRLGQILINYVSNAVKFTHRGEIVVGVEVLERDEREALLRFSVRDTGIGLTPQQCGAVFERFRQADATTGRRYGGSGLGLSISRQLAVLMGGEVGVDSRFGAGATFWFTARLGLMPQPVSDEPMALPWTGRRVLLVDDNDGARAALARMLERLGLEVSTAASGPGALAELALAQTACVAPELVVLDVGMPGMDGLATAREISRLGLSRPPVLLLLTAADSDHDAVMQALAAAARTEVLDKPVRPSALSRALARLLGVPTPALAGDHPHQAMASLAGVRVLLVEDDELNRDIAREWLVLAGARVDLAADGEQALDQLQRQACDIVLMDMRLPGMDGLSATREIRKQAALASLPIIGMTANALKNDRERCLAVGMNDHIAKPVVPRELSAKLLQWLGRPGAQAAGAQGAGGGDASDGSIHAAGEPGMARSERTSGLMRIDRALGLIRAGGSESLYHALLLRFATGQADAGQRIAQALAVADWHEAERLAHTLKGSAALIGASGLRELAGRLEQAIRERLAIVGTLQRELETVLAEVLGLIAVPAAEPTKAQAVAVLDEQAWRALSQRLQALLEDDDAASVELFHEHEAAIRVRLGGRHEALARALDDFDFVAALELLRATAAQPSGVVVPL